MGMIKNITNTLKSALGTEQLKSQTGGLKQIAHEIFSSPNKAEIKPETFQEALTRLNLTEADLERRKLQFFKLARIYIVLAIIIFIYMIYLLIVKAFLPVLACLGLLLIVFSQYFRCSFWLYQIRERRLGCTFREWLSEWMGKKR